MAPEHDRRQLVVDTVPASEGISESVNFNRQPRLDAPFDEQVTHLFVVVAEREASESCAFSADR